MNSLPENTPPATTPIETDIALSAPPNVAPIHNDSEIAAAPAQSTSDDASAHLQVLADGLDTTQVPPTEAIGASQHLQVLADDAVAAPHASGEIATQQVEPPRRVSKTVWASALALGALGCGATALWTQQQPISQPNVTPTPNGISTPATPGSAQNPGEKAPVFVAPSLQPQNPQIPPDATGGKVAPFSLGKSTPDQPIISPNIGKKPDSTGTSNPAPNAQVAQLFEQAVALQKAGNVAGATQKYRELLKRAPKTLEARTNLAILFAQNKQPQRAWDQLKAARDIAPKNPAVNWQLAQMALQMKRPQEAVEPLRAVIEVDAKNLQAQVLVAQVLGELKRPREAFAAWQKVARNTPKDGQAAMAAGSIALDLLKDPAGAETWLRRAIALPPADPREALLLGRALLAQKKASAAARVLTPAARQWKDVPEVTLMLADARAASGDAKGAVSAIRSVIAKVPESRDKGVPAGQLRTQLGRLLASQQKWKEAQRELEIAARLLPADADLRGLLADVSLRGNDIEGAMSHLRVLISLDEKRFAARVVLARILSENKRLDDAESEYRKYLQQRPNDAAIIAERAVVLEKMNRIDDALASWKRAGEILPDNPLPALQRGRVLREAKRDEAALEAFRFVLQTWPNDPRALSNAAELETKSAQHARAMGRWKALVATRPSYDQAYGNLLESARLAGQLDAATNFLKSQLAKNPSRPAAYVALLTVYKRAGRAKEGRAVVDNLARLYPKAKAPRLALQAFDESDASIGARPTPSSTSASPSPGNIAPETPIVSPTKNG